MDPDGSRPAPVASRGPSANLEETITVRSAMGSAFRVGLGMVVAAFMASAGQETGKMAPSVVATVGSLQITRQDFERRASLGRAEYERRKGEPLTGEFQAILDRQVLESLIRAYLLVLEAQRSGITVSEAEAEAQLKSDPFFNPNGTFSDAQFLKVK